ncbi:MAG TPA: hypothetical protein VMW57_08555 [Methyloceanibacter sp.]|nr:hypothetical protein [Methyloceanibacter sp.]
MQLLSISKETIRAHVIRYFHDVFHAPVSDLKPATNARKAFSYSDRAWRQLANVFIKLSWMRQIDAMLSPREIPGLKMVDDLVNAIWSKLNKIIAVSNLSTRLDTTSVGKFAGPKRQAARKPRRKASPAKAPARRRSKAKNT